LGQGFSWTRPSHEGQAITMNFSQAESSYSRSGIELRRTDFFPVGVEKSYISSSGQFA